MSDSPRQFRFEYDDARRRIPLGDGGTCATFRGTLLIPCPPNEPGSNDDGMKEMPAALKVLRLPPLVSSEEEALRVDREVLILRALATGQHPHIVRFYHKFQDREGPVIAMELIEGKTLEAWITAQEGAGLNDPAYIENVLALGVKLAWTLCYLSQLEIFHRDVKPANIMIRDDGNEPVLIDFGISRAKRLYSADSSRNHSHMGFVGSIPWASPEQFVAMDGSPPVITERTDVYALGATLWQAFTGTPPIGEGFGRPLEEKRRFQVSSASLPPVNGLSELLAEMMAFEQDGRPVPAEVAHRLAAIMDEHCGWSPKEPSVAMPSGPPPTRAPLPPFQPLSDRVQIGTQVIDENTWNHWSRPGSGNVSLQTDGKAPARMTFGEASALIDYIQAGHKDESWRYRLQTYEEWLQAGGITAAGVARGRRILTDLSSSHNNGEGASSLQPEWTDDWGHEGFPDCRRVVFMKDEIPESWTRHMEWPKGVVRLVRFLKGPQQAQQTARR